MSNACHFPVLIEINPLCAPLIFLFPTGVSDLIAPVTLCGRNAGPQRHRGYWHLGRPDGSCEPARRSLSSLTVLAHCFRTPPRETQALTLRCHPQKVLEVPLTNTVLIPCLGIKDPPSGCILLKCAVFTLICLLLSYLKQTPESSPGRDAA